MGKIVKWIDAPLIACDGMRLVLDSVKHRISHIDVSRTHVDLSSQDMSVFWKFPISHTGKQVEIFLYRTISIGAVPPRFRQSSAIFANFIWGQAVNIGFSIFDQLDCKFVKLVKIIGCVQNIAILRITQPLHVINN